MDIKGNDLLIKVDATKLLGKIEEAIIQDIENAMANVLLERSSYKSFDDFDKFQRKMIVLFKTAIKEVIEKESAEIRKEVKEEVIKRAVEKMSALDKKELVKGFLK